MFVDWILIVIKSNFGFFWKDGGISIADTKEATSFGLGEENVSGFFGDIDKDFVFWTSGIANGNIFLDKWEKPFDASELFRWTCVIIVRHGDWLDGELEDQKENATA